MTGSNYNIQNDTITLISCQNIMQVKIIIYKLNKIRIKPLKRVKLIKKLKILKKF